MNRLMIVMIGIAVIILGATCYANKVRQYEINLAQSQFNKEVINSLHKLVDHDTIIAKHLWGDKQ